MMENQLTIEIHKENLEKLAQMSQAEILEEKKKLEETLDPKIIQFLRNKNKFGKRSIEQDSKQCSTSVASKTAISSLDTEVSSDKKMKLSNNSEMDCENDTASPSVAKETTMDTEISNNKTKLPSDGIDTKMDCEDDTLSIPKSSKEIFEEGKQKGWLHMNTPEPEKLKWMEDLLEKKKDELMPEEYNARFDFNGE